jgi:hypothetical protein
LGQVARNVVTPASEEFTKPNVKERRIIKMRILYLPDDSNELLPVDKAFVGVKPDAIIKVIPVIDDVPYITALEAKKLAHPNPPFCEWCWEAKHNYLMSPAKLQDGEVIHIRMNDSGAGYDYEICTIGLDALQEDNDE